MIFIKQITKFFVLIGLVLIGFLLGILITVNVCGDTDINYTFENSILYDGSTIGTFDQEFNMRNPFAYTNHYPAYFSFENDDIDSVPIDWVNEGGGASVKANLNGHDKIVELINTEAEGILYNSFTPRAEGTAELWINPSQTNAYSGITLRSEGGDNHAMLLFWTDGTIRYHNGADWIQVASLTYIANTWYHFGLYWNAPTDIFMFYFDGWSYNLADSNDVESVGQIRLVCAEDAKVYIDAVGFEGSGWEYELGENKIPTNVPNLSILEVDKYEFALEGYNNPMDVGDDNPSGWTDIEDGPGDFVNIGGNFDGKPVYDRMVFIIVGYDYPDIRGLHKENFDVNTERLDISFRTMFIDMSASGGYTTFVIESTDTTEIIGLKIQNDGALKYLDPDLNLITLRNDLTTLEVYEFEFHIDYYSDTCVLKLFIDDVLDETYMMPLIETGKQGLKSILFDGWCLTDDSIIFGIDNIGVYDDGSSVVEEFGFTTIKNTVHWDFNNHNLFSITGLGYFHLAGASGSGDDNDYMVGDSFSTIKTYSYFDGTPEFINVYDISGNFDPFCLVFTTSTYFTQPTACTIEGALISIGETYHFLEFEHSGVDIDDNYFYVIGTKLYFTHTANDENLEYIQASFNINNFLSTNRSILFNSDFTGNSTGYCRMNYTDETSTLFQLPEWETTTSIILPQEKTIGEFIITITDYDNENNALSEGYISNLKFRYIPNIETSIITLALIEVIVPLIILILPTFGIYLAYGKKTIIPMFILMTLICYLGNLIPTWLFFIMIIASGGFLFMSKRSQSRDDM